MQPAHERHGAPIDCLDSGSARPGPSAIYTARINTPGSNLGGLMKAKMSCGSFGAINVAGLDSVDWPSSSEFIKQLQEEAQPHPRRADVEACHGLANADDDDIVVELKS